MKKYLLVLSGGVGKRFQHDLPKQYYQTGNGDLVITKSIKPFLYKGFREVTIVCDKQYEGIIENDLRKYDLEEMRISFARNGVERQDSIDNGIKVIMENNEVDDKDHLFLQEAVRPFVTEKMVNDLMEANPEWMSVCPAIHPAVLFGEMSNRTVSKLIPKSDIIELQVPKRHNIKFMVDNRDALGSDSSTILDESQVFTKSGRNIHVVEGDINNVKITYPSHKSLLDV